MSQKYKLKNIRLYTDIQTRDKFIEAKVKEIYKWACSDYACFKITNDFFDVFRNNNETKDIISIRLDRLKLEQEQMNSLHVNRYSYKKLKALILDFFENSSISNEKYRLIYSTYLEYVTMQWKKIPGKDGRVVFEPLIKYKRRELFGSFAFANSKCDVVYKNNKTKSFAVYECKFGLVTFVSHLTVNLLTETNRELLKQGRRAQRKINYLKECVNIFSNTSDVKDLDIKIVTLATKTSISASLPYLKGIRVITREDIEELKFYEQLSKIC